MKDALGHGSVGTGASQFGNANTPFPGPRSKAAYDAVAANTLAVKAHEKAVYDAVAAATLAQGHPKSTGMASALSRSNGEFGASGMFRSLKRSTGEKAGVRG